MTGTETADNNKDTQGKGTITPPDQKKMRLLICGDSLDQSTGLGYVAASLIRFFDATGLYEISYATIAGKDTTLEGAGKIQGDGFREIMEGKKIANVQVNQKDKGILMEKVIEDIAPEMVLSIHDPWYFDTIAFSAFRDSFYWVCYVTVEVPEYPPIVMSRSPIMQSPRKPIRDMLARADLVIPVTSVGYDMFTKHMKLTNVSEYCYLGVDYSSRCIEDVSKEEAFGDASEDSFVFMTMGFNSERKRMDKLVEAFYKFRKKMGNNNKYKLYIHSDLNAPTGGTDIMTMIQSLDLTACVLVPYGYRAGIGTDKATLYRRYKAADCYIAMPSGEGFGYGYAESMMHGKPVIYSNYGGHTCYCHDRGVPVKISDFVYAKYAYMKWAIVDTDDAARAMARIVGDSKLREALSKKGEEFVRKELDWPIVFEKFHRLFREAYKPNNISMLAGIPMKRLV